MTNAAENILNEIDGQLLPLDYSKNAAECLKCIAHPQRIRIIEILLAGKFSVDSISQLCGLSQPATSGHLRLMENKGLLESQRQGRAVYYFVADPQLADIINCLRKRFNSPET